MVNHIAMVLRYRLNTSFQLDSSRFTNQILFHNVSFDMHRFAPICTPEAGCPGGPPGTDIVEPRTNSSDPVCGIVVSGHRTIGRTVLDAFVPLVTHRTLGISILHCSESLGAGEK